MRQGLAFSSFVPFILWCYLYPTSASWVGVNGVKCREPYGTWCEWCEDVWDAVWKFCILLLLRELVWESSHKVMQFWILDVWDASDGRTQSAWESVSLSSASAAKSANKFQQISRKSFASRRSLTAKSCRPIGNKKKPSTHAPTSHRTHTQAHTASPVLPNKY